MPSRTHRHGGVVTSGRLGILLHTHFCGTALECQLSPHNTALEATGHSVGFVADAGLYPVARASAWALGFRFTDHKGIM
jgi:hypothetical protein